MPLLEASCSPRRWHLKSVKADTRNCQDLEQEIVTSLVVTAPDQVSVSCDVLRFLMWTDRAIKTVITYVLNCITAVGVQTRIIVY